MDYWFLNSTLSFLWLLLSIADVNTGHLINFIDRPKLVVHYE